MMETKPPLRTLAPRFVLAFVAALPATPALAQRDSATTITIHAALALDGRGGTVRDAIVTVRAGKIVGIAPAKSGAAVPATFELGSATVMPGMIDAHVHPGWYVNRLGTVMHGRDTSHLAESALGQAGNLYATLMASVTTIQSVGGAEDLDLRDAVERRVIPGPRILTSVGQISNQRLSSDSLRRAFAPPRSRDARRSSTACSPRRLNSR